MLIRITSNYFCAGIVVGERAAPIIKYMKLWNEKKITEYCKKKGWKCEKIMLSKKLMSHFFK